MKQNYKRLLCLMLALAFAISTPLSLSAVRHAERDIKLNIIVNDNIVMSDVYPYIEKGRTFVPIRFVAEELGFDVKWEGSTQRVIMTNGNDTAIVTVGSNVMTVNGREIILDAPASVRDQRTFVPLRAIAEAFGQRVDYSADYRTVYVGKLPKYNQDCHVVLYYGNERPVRTTYTINIVTLVKNINGQTIRYTSLDKLLAEVRDELIQFYTVGLADNVEGYLSTKQRQYQAVYSDVPEEKRLKDQYYVERTEDPLEGSWYGPGTYGDYNEVTDRYLYITSLGNNRYKIQERTILVSDGSQAFNTQYGTYNPRTNMFYVEESDNAYNLTGTFASRGIYSAEGQYYLENSYTRLSWYEKGNTENYLDKY